MILRFTKVALLIVVVSLLYSCNYNSSVMMRTDKDYQFDTPPSGEISEYIISNSDIFEFQL